MRLVFSLGIFLALLVSSLIDLSTAEPRVVCYYTNWSVYRPGTAKFNPQNVNPYLCTHLIYAFGGFTKDNQLKPFDKYQDIEQGGYAKFTGLKTYNKELKTMLAIGGWNEGSARFSSLVSSADRRAQLVKNTIKFLRQNKFDGLDLDWEYPAARDGGKPKDRENYAKLVQELREEFDRENQKTGRPRLLLTMAVPAGFEYIDKGYDVPKLNKYLDWFNLLSYDYHSSYEPSVNHHAPLYPIEEENEYSFDNDLNINATINYYLKNGADRDKLVLGIPTYGRSYTLFNPDSNEIGAPADGPGEQGDATREKGYLAYYEICQNLNDKESEWTVVQPNPDAIGPYAYNGNQWVGYDDEEIVRKKSQFVVENKLGGIMFWSIDNDDFRGLCNGKQYPLIEAAKEAYLDSLENGVQRKSQSGSNKRKQQQVVTTTRKSEAKKGKITTPAPPTTPSSGTDFKCEEEGFFPHPSDCKKYFWCLEAPGLGIVAHHFSCPSGLLFNKQADSCDYARNVYCNTKSEKTSTTTTTSTTTKAPTTEKFSYNKVSSIYKNPSRTTPRTTTTTVSFIDEIDTSDLEQEDPKVIKELIELIKKAGGIEELEKQLNIQEQGDGNSKLSATSAPASTINKSLVEKIKNRGSLFKSRPPLFNGASQPEKIAEQKASTSTPLSSQVAAETPKKYNTINRFSRPQSQNSGIESIPQSDAVLIEKPQYTSIARRKPAKPEVITENDYNNDSDRSVEESSNSTPENNKRYTSISRPRVPVPEDNSEESDEIDEEDDIPSTTTSRAPSKYINLSRRRLTTASFAESSTTREIPLTTTTSKVQASTTSSPRRRNPIFTEKTVLKTNSDQNIPSHDTLEITQLFKNIATDIEQETLTANKHLHDDEESNLYNVIALPTESVTENLPPPEFVTTIITNTQSPSNIDNQNANQEQVNNSESLNEIVDSVTAESVTDNDFDYTTIINDLIIDSGLSKKTDGFVEKKSNNNFIAPKPFSRTQFSTTQPPPPSPFSRNSAIFRSTQSLPLSTLSQNSETTLRRRVRPSIVRTTTESYSSQEANDEQFSTYSRPTSQPYRPGYRGTARFKYSTSRSGEYDSNIYNAQSINQQLIDDNRLRSLNLEKGISRPAVTRTSPSTTLTPAKISSKRPTRPIKISTTEAEEEETTTENRIIEAKNRFNLKQDDRPDRLRFELTAGGKIDFGFSSVKSRENAASSTKSGIDTSDASKVRVITGPLDKSPINITSSRVYPKGVVEEIPIVTSPKSVTVRLFSEKLNLNDIPLNKSDIESFVPNDALRTDTPITNTEDSTIPYARKSRLRPSVVGFKKRPNLIKKVEEENTTEQINDDEFDDETTIRTLIRQRPSQSKGISGRERIRVETEIKNELSNEISSQRISNRNRISQRGRGRGRNNNEQSSEIIETSSPRGFRSRQNAAATSEESEEVTQSKYLTRVRASDLAIKRVNALEDSVNSETQDVPEESTLRSRFRVENYRLGADSDDSSVENSLEEENEIDFTTLRNADDSEEETTLIPVKPRKIIRKLPKKIDYHAQRQTITESSKDFSDVESTSFNPDNDDDDDINEDENVDNNDDDYQVEFERTSSTSSRKPIELKTRPTRRLVTRKRIINANEDANQKVDEANIERPSTSPRTTTKKRVLIIRTRDGLIRNEVDVNPNTEETPTTEQSPADSAIKSDEPDVGRRRIKVFRARTTTERTSEESTYKSIVARTRVFKRPSTSTTIASPSESDEQSTSPKSINRYSTRRRVVKINKKPTGSDADENEGTKNQDIENVSESTTSTPQQRKRIFKVIREKKPRVIADRPLEEDSLLIKTDDQNQQIDQNENNDEKEIVDENVENTSEESSRPSLKYPTRPGGRISSVTIRKRPFTQGSRTSTVHPASARFTKEGVIPTRPRVTVRRRFKPGGATSESSVSVADEIDAEKKIALGERNKKIFNTKYRKFSTTSSPNITPHNSEINTDSETTEYDELLIDSTDTPAAINNDGNVLQPNNKPRFSLKNRFTTSTTPKPTTLHHVFAIDELDEVGKERNSTEEQSADEVIKKLQKLVEINRIVEVYSKEEKLKLLKNKKLKSIKEGELTVEKPPVLDKFGEISRQVIIKLKKVQPTTTTTDTPDEIRSPKSIMFAETVFGNAAETSTISLEGLFEREKKELEEKQNEKTTETPMRRKIPNRVAVRNRNTFTPRTSIQTTAVPTERTTIATTTLSERPKITTRVVRRKLVSRTPPLSRRAQVVTSPVPTTTTSTTTQKPEIYENFDDEEIASILPALTSVMPRRTPSPPPIIDTHIDMKTIQIPIHEDTSTVRPTTTFDQILEHQYKIKGLDKDFEEDRIEQQHYKNHQMDDDDKLIGVLGSQVKVILHSVSTDPEHTKIECLEFGNYPHPLSCKMYISCAKVRGFLEGFIFSCGEGMSFEQTTGTCIIGGCTRNNVKLLTNN